MLTDRERHVLGLARKALTHLGDAGAGPITTNSRAAGKLGQILATLDDAADEGVIDGDATDGPIAAEVLAERAEAMGQAGPLADEEAAEARRCIRKINEFFAAHRDVDERLGALGLDIHGARGRLDTLEARAEGARPTPARTSTIAAAVRGEIRVAEEVGRTVATVSVEFLRRIAERLDPTDS